MNSHGKCSLAVGAMTLSALLGSTVGAQTFQPIDQLSVVDSSGKTMGKLLVYFGEGVGDLSDADRVG